MLGKGHKWRRERGLERERSRERGRAGGDEGRRNSQKARAMRGLGIMSRGVDSAWNRKDSRSRWRRGEVDCMPRLWRGKVGSRRGGRGEKGGWASMADTLRSLGCEESCPKNQKAVVSRTKPNMVKSYVEATKVAKEKERAAARVDITTEEVGRNLSKLGHCIVGTWNHNAAKGDDLRGWGSQLTRIWRGGASFKDGKYFLGGVDLRLEKWNPETGCLKEGERSNEAWVRVVGLPVSMWDRDILRKIGDACGGFLAIDHQTEKMEDLQWARLLVKRNGGSPPSLVEVWIDGFCYEVTLWWEIRPVIKVPATGKRGKTVVTDAKEGGDASARAGGRVLGAMEGSRLEDCLMSEDGTQSQFAWAGVLWEWKWEAQGKGRAFGFTKRDGLAFRSSSPPASSKAQTEKGSSAMVRSRGPLRSPGVGISNCWGKDDQWGLRCGDETEWGGSPAPIALCWRKTQGMFRPPLECGVNQGGLPMQEIGHSQQFAGKCWDLVEISNDSMEDDRKALCLARPISQEEGAWVDEGWEESDLARSLGSGRFLDWGALEAQGTAGGILICWDKRT
ncbi:hypothetical protein CK203_080883 [Vitis vinifera]|uniref:Uncharacterized protein n=1 Tax=Vitis vinifera TaxID=29760 RepID=A0A438C0D5_VITVI|nr:hypothetical protein CK203_080883 [Vitis vinifera]